MVPFTPIAFQGWRSLTRSKQHTDDQINTKLFGSTLQASATEHARKRWLHPKCNQAAPQCWANGFEASKPLSVAQRFRAKLVSVAREDLPVSCLPATMWPSVGSG